MSRELVYRAALWVVIIGAANFAVFVGVAMYLGGDALNGKVEDGHYYLTERGRYTEVSESVFEYSRVHAYTTLVSWPVVLISAYAASRIKKAKAQRLES